MAHPAAADHSIGCGRVSNEGVHRLYLLEGDGVLDFPSGTFEKIHACWVCQEEIRTEHHFGELIGESAALRRVLKEAETYPRAANSFSSASPSK